MIEGIKIQGIKTPFARGLVMDRGVHYIPHSLTPYARNIRLRNGVSVRREGYTRIAKGSQQAPITNLISVQESLFAITQQKLYRVNMQDFSLDEVNTQALGENIATLKYDKYLVILNGANDGKVIDTTNNTITTLTIEGGAKPRFGEVYEQCIYLAGGGRKNNILYKSTVWGDGSQFPVFTTPKEAEQIPFRSRITGMAGTRERLFVWTEDSIEVLQDVNTGGNLHKGSIPIAGANALANPNMVVKADDKLFFWTQDNQMKSLNYVQGVSEDAVGDISHREDMSIKGFIDLLDEDQSTSFGYYHKKNKTIHWHLRLKGEPYTTIVLVYDLDTDSFLIDTNKYFTCVANHKLGYYAGSANEQIVYRDERGNADDGQAIQRSRKTAPMSLGSPISRKERRQINIYGEKEDDVEIGVDVLVDGKTVFSGKIQSSQGAIAGSTSVATATAPLGYEVQPGGIKPFEYVITRGFLRARGKDIQIIFSGGSFGECCLTGLEIGYKDLGEYDTADRAK
ncbi:MAG: hypothetical protein DLD55_01745 [candidate division SR1 bacterium]|nr:MAG: hypothetical protein DLD55_01745 [candidate division SR1 bacterium]